MKFVYLHGFASSAQSTKARFFERMFGERGLELRVPELDAGDFENLTIRGQLEVVRREASGEPSVLIGSSMGGYLAALYAAREASVQAVVLLAPAFCFGRRWPESLGAERMSEWKRTGRMRMFHYGAKAERELGFGLMEDATYYEDYPAFTQPGLILHGRNDPVVPVSLSEQFVAGRSNVRLVVYDSGHELTDMLEELADETFRFLALG